LGRLPDETAIVTGGAQGIDAAIGQRYPEEGARVALLDRMSEVIDAANAALPAQR
jgi:NAD(P)-dependent dehydrogenase (short-subunit alcohol dehydrogenase family)